MREMSIFGKSTVPMLHGGYEEVKSPQIFTDGFTKDFGYGFYVTNIQKQADTWAAKKGNSQGVVGVVTVYDLDSSYRNLNYRYFSEMTEEWLDFIIACRAGEKHDFDVVEGPMTDDTIYNYVTQVISGAMTREEFWILAKFRFPTHQVCLCSDEALKKLSFRGSYKVR